MIKIVDKFDGELYGKLRTNPALGTPNVDDEVYLDADNVYRVLSRRFVYKNNHLEEVILYVVDNIH